MVALRLTGLVAALVVLLAIGAGRVARGAPSAAESTPEQVKIEVPLFEGGAEGAGTSNVQHPTFHRGIWEFD
jgi:hypothetical protein